MKNPFLFIAVFFLFSCNTIKHVPQNTEETEIINLDTMFVFGDREVKEELEEIKKPYRNSHPRKNDLLHTKLELQFDWQHEKVIGKATLTLKPYFYPTEKLVLDAKNFEFKNVSFAGSNTELNYEYDGKQIDINLGKTFTRDEKYQIFIDYIATPVSTGGSAVITSDKGLYFINPQEDDPDIPQQIWTQCETEAASKWFPTIDSPNERCTEEISLTVNSKFKTLSNGILVSSVNNVDGTRTDYWKMDKPHAPYLFMVAVGDYAVVRDTWNGKEISYYVEPKYEKHAKEIFRNTEKMLSFYSKTFGVDFPWQKYAQIIVRNFVSGAMENTTAVVFGDYIQQISGDLVDELMGELVVAHEMSHHWFGDYVTCESWSNIPLNESFANYSEYLWLEYQYGKDEADYHLSEELEGYLREAAYKKRPIIDFYYDNREDVFDAHSYNKGGCILHMLRNYVGDEAFFASLQKYLTDNAFSDVEAHELRLAFEDITGEDLNWFFNQWFFSSGHPDLDIIYGFDAKSSEALITVKQLQKDNTFRLPVVIEIYDKNGTIMRRNVVIDEKEEIFRFKVPAKPALINFDADKVLVCEKTENKTDEEYVFQYFHGKNFLDRYESISALMKNNSSKKYEVLNAALYDNFYELRLSAITYCDKSKEKVVEKIASLAKNDPNANVRAEAFYYLMKSERKEYLNIAKEAIEKEKSNMVISAALRMLVGFDINAAEKYAKVLENSKSNEILNAISEIYVSTGNPENLSFFENKMGSVDGYFALDFIKKYANLAIKSDIGQMLKTCSFLEKIALSSHQSLWKKLAAASSINTIHSEIAQRLRYSKNNPEIQELQAVKEQILKMLKTIKENETNEQLKNLFNLFPSE